MTTLVIGARGAIGRYVVDGLRAADLPVRASVRDLAKADFVPGVDVVQADLTQPATLGPALDGVTQVFLYADPGSATDFAQAALAAGVERVVLLSSGSVLLPWATANPIAVDHRMTEDLLTDAGLSLIPIRPLVLANNALNWATSIRKRRTVQLVHPESLSAPIHERDIAAVAVAALRGAAGEAGPDSGRDVGGATPGKLAPYQAGIHRKPQFVGGAPLAAGVSGLLTGAEALTLREQVERIAAAIGAEIRIEEITEDQAWEIFGDGDPETVDAILHFIRRGTESGGWAMTSVAEQILGRKPVKFAGWATDHAADFR